LFSKEKLRTIEVCSACRRTVVEQRSVCDFFQKLDYCGRYIVSQGSLNVSFVSKKKMREVHVQFLGDGSLTDVITFAGDPRFDFAGEIVVCPLYAWDQCKIYGTTFQDEVKLYLIHGFLHLAGLKDQTPKDTQMMRAGEAFCLDFLKDLELEISLK
jgi:probable rRNA maturation factor